MHTRSRPSFTSIIPVALAIGLAACGSGSDDEGDIVDDGELIKITSNNAKDIAQNALVTPDIFSATTLGVMGIVLEVDLSSPARSPSDLRGKSLLSNGLIDELSSRQTYQENRNCAQGGNATVTFDDANNNNTPDAGDSLAFDAINCATGEYVLNGGLKIMILALEETENDTSFSFDITYDSLAVIEQASGDKSDLNGGVMISFDSNDARERIYLSSDRLDYTANGQALTYTNYSDELIVFSDETWTRELVYSASGSIIGGRFTAKTDPIGQGDLSISEYPLSGVFTFTGSDGSFVSLDAGTGDPDTVMININGNTQVITWASLGL